MIDPSAMNDDPGFQDWVKSQANNLDNLSHSTVSVSVLSGPFDVEHLDHGFVLCLGAALWLDKPILLCVVAGTKVPEHLVRVADAIVEMQVPVEQHGELNMRRIQEAVESLGLPDPEADEPPEAMISRDNPSH